MIVVTLGTHPAPMDRLIVALDDLVDEGQVTEEIVITSAAYRVRPRHARGLGIRPYDELVEMIRGATIVITHGGPASIYMAIAGGHVPIVVPRDPAFQEHVDGHQLRFATWLGGQREIAVVTDMERLGAAIAARSTSGVAGDLEPPVPVEAIAKLRAILTRRA